MSEVRVITGIVALGCAVALAGSLDPRINAVASATVLVLLGTGALAGSVAYFVHVLRIRRQIERGDGMRWVRVEPPPRPHRAGEPRTSTRRASDNAGGSGPRPSSRSPQPKRVRRGRRRSER